MDTFYYICIYEKTIFSHTFRRRYAGGMQFPEDY